MKDSDCVVLGKNLVLKRTEFKDDGILSNLRDEIGNLVAVCLEHSYDKLPKIPNGVYKCVLGVHELSNKVPFNTYEISGVAGHSGLLFHMGTSDGDSEGCVLVGHEASTGSKNQTVVTNSREAFKRFMELQGGAPSFQLTVTS